ncbi:MAG: dihydroneopterin aldolase [Candidatus Kapabacteria bacterium]|nr:dihydroneopterin aldolase [Candidatus Kapabacteria bacterium]
MKSSSLVKLTINNAEFYAYHGVKTEEKKLGGKFQVDLDLYYNPTNAIVNDDVNYAVNYEEAIYVLQQIIIDENYNLIETLANDMLQAIFEKFDNLEKATIRVRKFNIPIQQIVRCMEVEQTMERLSQ